MKLIAKGYFIFLLSCISFNVLAYIGPGMGGGILASLIGIVGALFLLLFGILYYPIKRLIKKRKEKKRKGTS